jgi:hypothetical protein
VNHSVFTTVRARNERRKKERVTGDTLATFEEYMPPIIKDEMTKNKFRWWKPIFDHQEPLYCPKYATASTSWRVLRTLL